MNEDTGRVMIGEVVVKLKGELVKKRDRLVEMIQGEIDIEMFRLWGDVGVVVEEIMWFEYIGVFVEDGFGN